jgi:primosomal protein N' (replication factor Y) (superfamily II helicase)
VPAPFYDGLDYKISKDLIEKLDINNFGNNFDKLIGLRVRVSLGRGRREVIGVIINLIKTSKFEKSLKNVIEIIDSKPIYNLDMQKVFSWMHAYYHVPMGVIYHCAWPSKLSKGDVFWPESKQDIDKNLPNNINKSEPLRLLSEQKVAKDGIANKLNEFAVHLLHGVTGSGKTEVYLQLIADVLSQGKSVLVMVPEINLTPQMLKRFEDRFSDEVSLYCLHSKVTAVKKLKIWREIATQASPARNDCVGDLILGTRSSIFIPSNNLGLIIIDEAHDESYRQQSDLRYCALKVAMMRAKHTNIPIILGSATPSLEILNQARNNKYNYWRLTARASALHDVKYNLIDLRGKRLEGGISAVLFDAIKTHLSQKGQVFIFINRRGFSPLLFCHSCGWVPTCDFCDCNLTYHQDPKGLFCHHCGRNYKKYLNNDLNNKCSKCESESVVPVGSGTQRVESVLKDKFPDANILRIDANTTSKKGEFEKCLKKIHSGEAQILVGTQMLAKGHHFPNLTMVAMINLDDALFSSDFRATEKLGQLLVQVAGRAGRADKAGEVYLQTHQPDNPYLRLLLEQDLDAFTNKILKDRADSKSPPFSYDAIWKIEGKNLVSVQNYLQDLKQIAQPYLDDNLRAFGPAPCILAKKAGMHQYQLLIRSKDRSKLHGLIAHQRKYVVPVSGVRVFLDVDPVTA